MSVTGLRQFIARALEKGYVRESFHSEVERADRNISDDDISYGLGRKDWTVEKIEPSKAVSRVIPSLAASGHSGKTEGFLYLIRTVDVDQDELHLLVKPDTKTGNLKIVTKY